jgi:hypothetical protein
MSKAELPIVEIANCNGDRQAGPRHLLSVEEVAGAATARGYQQVGALLASRVDGVAN